MSAGCSKTEPLPQRQLMSKGLKAPKGPSRFLKATPRTGSFLSPARIMVAPWDAAQAIAVSHCRLRSSTCPRVVEESPSCCERWVRELMSSGSSFWPCAPAVLICLLCGRSDVKPKAGVTALRMGRWGVVHPARLRGKVRGPWSSENQPPAALALCRCKTLLSSPLTVPPATAGFSAARPGAAAGGQATRCDHCDHSVLAPTLH